MRQLIFFAAILAVTLVIFTDACRFSKKKLKIKIEKYKSCMAQGFEPSLDGCSTTAENMLNKNEASKCGKLEKYLEKCGHTCEVEEEKKEGWSEWSEWSECSSSCGPGHKTRTRTCTGSRRRHCEGDEMETLDCSSRGCGGFIYE